MKITILGARGSVPTDGRECLEFGGATSCVLIETDDQALYLDAGTGIMHAPDTGDKAISVVLTHPHIDHLIGLTFFPYLMKKDRHIDIYGAVRCGLTVEEQYQRLISPPFWPLSVSEYPADTCFHDLTGPVTIGDINLTFMESNHPGGGLIVRADQGGHSVVYATDFEHGDDHRSGESPVESTYESLAEIARDTDLLIYDAQFTDEEYPTYKGYGHSTVSAGLGVMRESGARRISFVHHDPRHTDDILRSMETAVKSDTVSFAREGDVIVL